MEIQTKDIMDELRQIRIDIEIIKDNMPDKEMFLTADEEVLFERSFENEKNDELISSEELKKELEI